MTPLVDAFGDPLPPFAAARLGTARWHHRGLCIDRLDAAATGHDALRFDRDGARLIVGGHDSTALVFDVAAAIAGFTPATKKKKPAC